MTEKNGVYDFIKYLDNLGEMSSLFKSLTTVTEIMGEIPLSDEQIEMSNVLLNKIQKDWQKEFLTLLEVGVEWLKNQEDDLE